MAALTTYAHDSKAWWKDYSEKVKAQGKRARERIKDDKVQAAGYRIAGTATGTVVAGFVGFAEQRWAKSNGTPASLGPVSLPAAVGWGSAVAAVACDYQKMPKAATVMHGVSAANLGLWAGTYGRVKGASSRANAAATVGQLATYPTTAALPAHEPDLALSAAPATEPMYLDDVGADDDEQWTTEEMALLGL